MDLSSRPLAPSSERSPSQLGLYKVSGGSGSALQSWRREVLELLLAAGFDLLGEPAASVHPVVWYGRLIRVLERRAPRGQNAQLKYGVIMLLLAFPLVLASVKLFQGMIESIEKRARKRGRARAGFLASVVLTGAALKPFFALRMLVEAGAQVRRPLEQGAQEEAREALRSLVSRDRSHLSPELVAAAAIESLAENVSDSVVAPLWYYAHFGLPGAALYRLANTFDSLVGYHGKYEYLGKAAARLDDLLNLIPARLSALLIIVCAPLYGGSSTEAWRMWRRDADKTESPNAGHPMAAAAGALGVRLEKVEHYVIGEEKRKITPAVIAQAERMTWWVGACAFLLSLAVRIWRRAERS